MINSLKSVFISSTCRSSWYSTTRDSSLLASISKMVTELRGTMKRKEKFMIIQRYPDTHEFLRAFIDCGPLYIRRTSASKEVAPNEQASEITDLLELMKMLSERKVTGHDAIRLVQDFINTNCEYKQLILDILERDLKVGMATKLIGRSLDSLSTEPIIDPSAVDARHVTSHTGHKSSAKVRQFPKTSKELPVALGLPLQHPSVKLAPEEGTYWLISRKLDGIRCLAQFKSSTQQITLYTRAGNPIEHLTNVQQELQSLAMIIKRKYPKMHDFYIDGELCVLSEKAAAIARNTNDNHHSMEMDGMTDDFRSTLSVVLSKPSDRLVIDQSSLYFFIFDLIDQDCLADTILSERLSSIETILANEAIPLHKVKLLTQYRTKDPLEFRQFLTLRSNNNWEGLIVRRDAPHVPKRTRDIIKVKDFYEAEFAIEDYRLELMQVVRDGRLVEEELLSAVKVKFGDNDVWVGSGFSQEERRRLARNPELLTNAQVTIRYFQESSNKKNEHLRSLRFPTIKAMYPGGRHA